ncbi:MAG: hypothetical protein M3N91_01925 [Pseudomonadota bacterium]|nr:hypothetical protein [Pseudomonadota bacterium]
MRIIRAIKGQERLALVFWGYCVAGTLIVRILSSWVYLRLPDTYFNQIWLNAFQSTRPHGARP